MKEIIIKIKGSGHPKFYELLQEIGELHDAKNSDYATIPLSNFRECKEFDVPPWLGCLTRMTDKWSRIKNLAKLYQEKKKQKVKTESLRDTLLDLAVYSLIDIILLEEEQ